MNSGDWMRRGMAAVAVWLLPAALSAHEHISAHEQWGGLLAQTLTKTGGKNYIVESIVTVALFGMALWAICKSSRRV